MYKISQTFMPEEVTVNIFIGNNIPYAYFDEDYINVGWQC